MVRKSISQAVLLLALATILSIAFVSSVFDQHFNSQNLAQLKELSKNITLIQSNLDRYAQTSNNDYNVYIEDLISYSFMGGVIIELDGIQVAKIFKKNFNSDNTLIYSQLIHHDSEAQLEPMVEITSYLIANKIKKTAPIETASMVLSLMVIWLVVFGILYYKFKWIVNLEDYAHLLVTTGNKQLLRIPSSDQNIITHAINQLILNNSLLNNSKMELANKIRKTSYIDENTQLGNHLFFKAELQVRLHNHEEAESGLVFILLFKNIDSDNDISIEQQCEIAELLKAFTDNINLSIVARLKESEFGLILPDFTAIQTDTLCKKLIQQLGKSVFNLEHPDCYFVDIGISAYKQGFGYYNIMAEADMALRNAQLQGANSWYIYGEPLAQHKSRGSLRWRSFLEKVLDRREIMLYGQKLNYYSDNEVQHCEILARIRDGKEILSADHFLVMANECGLSAEFDRQIISTIIQKLLCTKNTEQQQKYSVNIFISSLLDATFISWLTAKLSSYPSLNKQLIFELPENHVSRNIHRIAPLMKQISRLGVNWCVAHFGSPEEDLSYLHQVSIDMVKIDRRVINNISESPSQQLLLTSIVVSLRNSDIKIFAEGVEKEADAEYLVSTGLDGAQGYYYDKPHKIPL